MPVFCERIVSSCAQTEPHSLIVIPHHNLLTDCAPSRDWEWTPGILNSGSSPGRNVLDERSREENTTSRNQTSNIEELRQ
jgi:hypothetical protein